jgi:hypothetical protein
VLNIEQEKMRRDGDGDKGGDRPGDAGRDQAGGQGNDAGGDQDADADANPNESDEDKKRREELEKIARNGGIEVEQRYEFTVQIIWVPRSPRERFALKQERLKKEKDAAAVVPADPQN